MATAFEYNSTRTSAAARPDRRSAIRFARFLADLLDQRFIIPGTDMRIGLDPLMDLIPGVGDALANLAGMLILVVAAQMKVPKIVLARMGLNVALNALIGAVPLAGAVFSIWFRSNAMNAALLERYAAAERRRAAPGDWLFVTGVIAAVLLVIIGAVAAVVWLLRAIF